MEPTNNTNEPVQKNGDYPKFEREKVFLGFHPMAIVDSIINAINDHTATSMDELESFMLQDKALAAQEEEVRKGVDNLFVKLQGHIDTATDRMEVYVIRNIFTVASDIALSAAENPLGVLPGGQAVTEEEDQEADRAIIEAWKRIQAAQKLKASLLAEEAALDANLKDLEAVNQVAEVMQTIIDGKAAVGSVVAAVAATEALAPLLAADETALGAMAVAGKKRKAEGAEEGGKKRMVTGNNVFRHAVDAKAASAAGLAALTRDITA